MCIPPFEGGGTTQYINIVDMTKREKLKQDLAWLGLAGGRHIYVFKCMYSNPDLDISINEIVDNISNTKLDWALKQVQNSIDKLSKT
jgi:hypothetical protein